MVADRGAPPKGASLGWGGLFLVMAAGLALTAGQGQAAASFGRLGYAPEWALILTVYLVWRAEKWMAVAAAFILGLFRDAAGGGPTGLYPAALVAAAWFFQPYRLKIRLEAPLPLMLCIFGLDLGSCFLVLAPLMAVLGWPGEGFNPAPVFLWSALASALAAPPLFWLLNRLTRLRLEEVSHG